jgi:ribosomal protein S18 acetylase RimI-like enzyme
VSEPDADPTVRELEPSERDEVRALHEACFEEGLAFNEIVLDRLFRHQHAINLVAATDDGIAAYACAIHGARPKARLLTIQTHPKARGQGLARRLLDELETRLRARQAASLSS